MRVHKYNNGIECYEGGIFQPALSRYEEFINLHEPFEEVVFDHILKNFDIQNFIDIGSAWGYYSILVKRANANALVIGFDPDDNMIKRATENVILNNLSNIEFRKQSIPRDTSLFNVVTEVGIINLLKIDIQGEGTEALKSAEKGIRKIRHLVLGTHGREHDDCLLLLEDNGFTIKMNFKAHQIPIQPDGLIWAYNENC
jgi:cyclopropane fatty-acyl-phospholipid synthase-like methyltransferase